MSYKPSSLFNLIQVINKGVFLPHIQRPFVWEEEPHIDHIYPRHALSTKLGLSSSEVNTLGNYRFVGATDNIRKRAELPDSYFGRLKSYGAPIEKHLLLDEFAADTKKLVFDVATYRSFRERRLQRIWEICNRTVNPEIATGAAGGTV